MPVSKSSSKTSDRITKPLLSGAFSSVSASDIIIASFRTLGFNSSYADSFGAWLISQQPAIDGTVTDETPNAKDRTELSNQATTLDGVNQYFDSGQNTGTSKTQLSVFCWIKTSSSTTQGIVTEFRSVGSDRGHAMFVSSDKLRVVVSDVGTNAVDGKKDYSTTSNITDGEWHHVGFTLDTSANEMLIYIDGKEAGVTKTTDANLDGIFDAARNLEIGFYDATNYANGSLQLPTIHESVLTPAQIVSLFDDDFASVPEPDLAWLLIGDTAHDLTGNSNDITATNSATLSEDDENPVDWLNLKGWNLDGSDYIPKQWSADLDTAGNGPDDSNSFGQVRRNAQLVDGPCLTMNGTNHHATEASLVGTETVISSGGTSTPSISAGQIDFTAGTCFNLVLSNGSTYPIIENTGSIAYDTSGNDRHLTLVNSPSWTDQDEYHYGESVGYSLYEHASSPDLYVPLKADGTALSITPPTGYTKTSDNPAGSYLNGTAKLDLKPVTNSSSAAPIYYGASFDGVTSYIELSDNFDWSNPFDISFDYLLADNGGAEYVFGSTSNGAYTCQVGSGRPRVRVNGSFFVHSTAGSLTEFNSAKITYTGGIDGEFAITLNGVTETFTNDAVSVSQNIGITVGSTNTLSGFYEGQLKNISATNNALPYVELPLYKDSLDRSANCNHGTDTDVTYLSETPSSTLEPDITATNTMAAETDRKIIQVGQR